MLLTSAFAKDNSDISLVEFNVLTTATRKLGVKSRRETAPCCCTCISLQQVVVTTNQRGNPWLPKRQDVRRCSLDDPPLLCTFLKTLWLLNRHARILDTCQVSLRLNLKALLRGAALFDVWHAMPLNKSLADRDGDVQSAIVLVRFEDN